MGFWQLASSEERWLINDLYCFYFVISYPFLDLTATDVRLLRIFISLQHWFILDFHGLISYLMNIIIVINYLMIYWVHYIAVIWWFIDGLLGDYLMIHWWWQFYITWHKLLDDLRFIAGFITWFTWFQLLLVVTWLEYHTWLCFTCFSWWINYLMDVITWYTWLIWLLIVATDE